MPKIVITTVGTSLLDLKKEWVNKRTKQNIEDLSIEQMKPALDQTGANPAYFNLLQIIIHGLPNAKPDRLPAEISSLNLMKLNKNDDKIVLLSSETPDGWFCTKVLEKYFIDRGYTNVIAECVEGLTVEDVATFVQHGLPNLNSVINRHFAQEGYERYINFTGGYKGSIPLISGKLFNGTLHIKLCYLFENDTNPELIYIDKSINPANPAAQNNIVSIITDSSAPSSSHRTIIGL